MSYQGMMLGAVGSASGAISIATMLYRQTPEYKAKTEAKQAVSELERKADVAEKIGTDEAKEAYYADVANTAANQYVRSGDKRFLDLMETANKPSPTEQATQAMNTAKQERRQKDAWRNERTNFGMSVGELADRLGPEARAAIEKEMNN